jgi:hypothetical protein
MGGKPKSGGVIVSLVAIAIIIVLLSIFAFKVYYMKAPTPGRDCRATSDWLWSDNCLYIQELQPDYTLSSPTNLRPYLIDFTYSPSSGNSFFLPVWYRFRYVNVLTGGYSDFSNWTQTPVISGGCCLPCVGGPGNCGDMKTGYSSCSFNRPTIGISSKDSQYNPTQYQESTGTYIYLNLHRYVGTSYNQSSMPPDNAVDEIIGTLQPGQYINGVQYYSAYDVYNNPCKEGCITPSWCTTPGSCTGTCN